MRNDVDGIGRGQVATVFHGIAWRLNLEHASRDEVPVLIEEAVQVIAIDGCSAFESEMIRERADAAKVAPSRHREPARDAPEPDKRSGTDARSYPRANRCGHRANCGRVRPTPRHDAGRLTGKTSGACGRLLRARRGSLLCALRRLRLGSLDGRRGVFSLLPGPAV